MRYIIVFNLFCLAVFIQMANSAPLVDENETVIQPQPSRSWRFIRGLIAAVQVR